MRLAGAQVGLKPLLRVDAEDDAESAGGAER